MNKNIKLVLLDLDGTLLDGESEVPNEFEEVIDRLSNIGVRVGIATGRNYGTLKLLFKGLEKKLVLITCNGAGIYVNGTLVEATYIKENDVKEILDIFYRKRCDKANIVVMRDDRFFATEDNTLNDFYREKHFSLSVTDDLYKNISEVTALAADALSTDRAPVEIFNEFKGDVTFTDGGFGCINMQSSFTSKGIAAAKLAKYLNISIDNIMALGDAGNDYELLSTVGYPVAMKNAQDEIKKISKDITLETNKDNGCLKYLISFFRI